MTDSEQFYVPRTCTEAVYGTENRIAKRIEGRSLSGFRESKAYVLLGDPGAGKTECFKHEACQSGGQYIRAREFIGGIGDKSSWIGKTLFIDGLDEIRVGSVNGLLPLDDIRGKLIELECPPFRISCREADWLGSGDRKDFEMVVPEGELTCLHLEKLDDEKIRLIIQHESRTLDAQEFLTWADDRGIMQLLGNPQILILMIKVVTPEKSSENWPKTREQAFDLACRQMIIEKNRFHQQASEAKYYSDDDKLEVAGKLFAHQLISNIEGYALSSNAEDKHYPFYKKVFNDDLEKIETVLKTNLFKLGGMDEQQQSIHRSVAEFLAAKYLVRLAEQGGLPVGRMLSLITAVDGGVVTSLRGLFAWFVTLGGVNRNRLLVRDPLGIVLYGDVTTFSVNQKQVLLFALGDEAKKYTGFRNENWVASPFGALATPDMEDVFRGVIESQLRDEVTQALAQCVIDAMENGVVYPNLERSLCEVVKDHTWWPGIRRVALQIFIRDQLEGQNGSEKLLDLLEGVKNGRIEDKDDELLGILLTKLYPTIISTHQILDYIHRPKNDHMIGYYYLFWSDELVKKSSKKQITELLDQLIGAHGVKQLLYDLYYSLDFLGKLLVEGLYYSGDDISISRLYDWLGIGLDKYGSPLTSLSHEESPEKSIRQWISERPDRFKALVKEGERRYRTKTKEEKLFYDINAKLFDTKVPADIGHWYLDQAALAMDPDIAESFFKRAWHQLVSHADAPDFTLDDIVSWTADHPQFDTLFKEFRTEEDIDWRFKRAALKSKRLKEGKKRRASWIERIIKQKEEIRRGTAQPAIFRDFAFAYYGHLHDAKGDTPKARLRSMFSGHLELYKDALLGMKNTINRPDLPSVEAIIEASVDGREYFIGHGILAGLDEIAESDPGELNRLNDQQCRHAIAFYLTTSAGKSHNWFEVLLKYRSDQVSEVFTQYAIANLKAKKEHMRGIYQLAYDSSWEHVARKAAIPILEKYQVRSKKAQISDLDCLLKAALRYGDKRLSALVDKKIQHSSMDVMQRSYWLAAGLIIDPDNYLELVVEFMEAGSKQIAGIAGFLSTRYNQWQPEFEFPDRVIGVLIEKLGSYFKPYGLGDVDAIMTPAIEVADLVMRFINELSSREDAKVSDELERLLAAPELASWQTALKGALYNQRKLLRDAQFQQPDLRQVRNTLNNSEPANSSDLMALTLVHLEDIAHDIRESPHNAYKLFWNTDSQNIPVSPKVEDACRDVLLKTLHERLAPLKIEVIKEGYYTNDKRSDIRVSYNATNGFNVPIEIKRDIYREKGKTIWTAIEDQLIPNYTQDPGAQGYGIYIVFWFGTGKVPPPPQGKNPRTASELKKMLGNMMEIEKRRLIGLCVIDCSRR